MRLVVGLSVVATLAFALGAPLSRVALPVTAAEVTFWRLALATGVVLAVALVTGRPAAYLWDWRTFGLGGVLFLHFFLFTLAAQTTTTAHTLTLVYISPVLVAIGSALVLHEPPRMIQMLGVVVAVIGVSILVGFEPAATHATVSGGVAALGSGALFAVYVLAGRYLRKSIPLTNYVLAVYGWAAVWAFPLAVLSFDSAAYDGIRVLIILVLGIVPLGVGHTLINAAVRRGSATVPNVITTQEVTGGMILSFLIHGETLGPNTFLGVGVAILGVVLVIAFSRNSGGAATTDGIEQ
ncbi:MAG: hypothetical protein CL790_01935 [Chloroflexi bacterium]|nr:hypothetical protein [Chloroflexota bacterium]HCU73257.1 hypothetical protein [Chloroflexota bacterium]